MIDRVGDRNRQPPTQHKMQGVGDVAFVKQDVAADEVLLVAGGGDWSQHRNGCIGEEFGTG